MGSFLGIFVNTVNASITRRYISFDDGTVLNQYSNAYMTTYDYGSNGGSYLSTVAKLGTDGLGYFLNDSASGFLVKFNFTDKDVTGFNVKIRAPSNPEEGTTFKFVNNTNAVIIWLAYSSGTWNYKDNTGIKGIAAAFIASKILGFSYNNDGSVKYRYDNTNVTGDPYKTTTNGINAVWIQQDYYVNDRNVYLDDVNITYGSSGTSSSGCTSYESYSSLGSLTSTLPMTNSDDTIEQQYDVVSSMNIYGVSLPISISQYTYDSDYSHYLMRINGLSFTACSISDYLSWEKIVNFDLTGSPVVVVDEKIVMEFSNSNGRLNGMLSSLDRDFDGNKEYKHSNVAPNGIYDGTNGGLNTEFVYKIYYTNFVIPDENPNLGNNIQFSGYAYLNSSIPLYYLNDSMYSGIIVQSTVDSLAPDKYLRLYYANNKTEITNTVFPTLINNYVYFTGIIAFKSGNFYVNITNSAKTITYSHSHFCVINNPISYPIFIQSTPPITICNDDYTINYKYYQENGHSGIIAMFLNNDINNLGSASYHSFLILPNTTNTFSYRPLFGGCSNHYWTFFILINGTYLPTGIIHTHGYYTGDSENNINTIPENEQLINTDITIYGSHSFIGQDVRIFINGKSTYLVGTNGSFSIEHSFNTIGMKNISIGYYSSNGTLRMLSHVLINIYLSDEKTDIDVLFSIPTPYSYFAGTFIIILLTLTPIIFGYMFKMDLSSIPQFLYLVFALVGFIVSLLLGFFPMWSIIVLIIVGSLIVIIMWLQRKMV